MLNGETSSSSARNVIRSSSISGEMYNIEKSNGGNPDSASISSNKKRRSSLGAKMVAIVGLSQWSKSTMQLNHPGCLAEDPQNFSGYVCVYVKIMNIWQLEKTGVKASFSAASRLYLKS
ncbi:UNVERIFIED_CONTAM: hypothetical protein K2H54_047209 [Gekko kuhli]